MSHFSFQPVEAFRSLSQRVLQVFLASVFLIFLAAGASAQGSAMRLPVDPEPLVAVTAAGEVRFDIEIADEAHERQRGLMFRQSMPQDRGMLFIFPAEGRQGFWMQNTPLPLDLLFVAADGTVRAIAPGTPFSTASISPDVESQFVLELVAGTAQKTGIEVGDRLRHPRIEAAGAQ
ncbi:DUF192 domain-containing protein [Nitratireductor aquimarinus]|uniref:DUF192 domain-containing protein n=1 Tax=Nitratireductor aquimarinus TaxID=889300 RepID=UPI003B5C65BD